MKGRVKASTVALAAMLIAGAVFWLQVSRVRRGMMSYGSGGIGAVSAEVPGPFPMAPLLQTGLLAFPPGSEVPRQAVTAAPTAIDTMTVIDEGLKPGEQVVTDGQLRLVPGSKVQQKGAGRGQGGGQGASPSPGQGDQGGGRKRGAGGSPSP